MSLPVVGAHLITLQWLEGLEKYARWPLRRLSLDRKSLSAQLMLTFMSLWMLIQGSMKSNDLGKISDQPQERWCLSQISEL